jgi:energy-converting hydrogenase Eha subunit C
VEYLIFGRTAVPSTSFPETASAFPHGTALLVFSVVFIVTSAIVALLLRRPLKHLPASPIAALVGGFVLVVSWGAIEGYASGVAPGGSLFPSGPSTWISDAFEHMGRPTHPILTGEELSTKPATWTDLSSDQSGEIAQVKGALLANTDLRFAEARSELLVNADLRHADLRYSSLVFSDLRGALLAGADLRNADLRNARLQGACLARTKCDGSWLGGANLTKADLSAADLKGGQGVSAEMLKAACVSSLLPSRSCPTPRNSRISSCLSATRVPASGR